MTWNRSASLFPKCEMETLSRLHCLEFVLTDVFWFALNPYCRRYKKGHDNLCSQSQERLRKEWIITKLVYLTKIVMPFKMFYLYVYCWHAYPWLVAKAGLKQLVVWNRNFLNSYHLSRMLMILSIVNLKILVTIFLFLFIFIDKIIVTN